MSISFAKLPNLTIDGSGTDSNVFTQDLINDAIAIVLIGMVGLQSKSYVIQGRRHGATTWVTLQEGYIGDALADVVLPAADKALTYNMETFGFSAFSAFRIHSPSSVTGDQTWEAAKLWRGI